MKENELIEHELTVEDYKQAAEQVVRAKGRVVEGKALSKKDRAMLTFAADAEAAHRSADLLRSVLFPSGEEVEANTVKRLKAFRDYIDQGLRTAKEGTLVGESIAIEAILNDFEAIFVEELNR